MHLYKARGIENRHSAPCWHWSQKLGYWMFLPKLNAPAEIHWRRSNMNTRDPILMKSVEVLKDCRSLNAAAEMNCPMSRSVEKVPIHNEKRCSTVWYVYEQSSFVIWHGNRHDIPTPSDAPPLPISPFLLPTGYPHCALFKDNYTILHAESTPFHFNSAHRKWFRHHHITSLEMGRSFSTSAHLNDIMNHSSTWVKRAFNFDNTEAPAEIECPQSIIWPKSNFGAFCQTSVR